MQRTPLLGISGLRRLRPAGWQLARVLVVVPFVVPLVWLVAASLREPGRAWPRAVDWVPRPAAWGNYPAAVELVDLGRLAANSALVAGAAVPLTVVVASWAGFALAQLEAGTRARVVGVSLAAAAVPLAAVWLPRFVLYERAGLLDTRAVLVLPALGGTSPFFALLFLRAFLRVPAELWEAARLDGAGAWRVWAGVGLPLVRPTVVAVAVLAFVHSWGSFVEPLLFVRSAEKMTLTQGLAALQQLPRSGWPLLMAAAAMTTAPVVAVFLLAQRFLREEGRERGWLGR